MITDLVSRLLACVKWGFIVDRKQNCTKTDDNLPCTRSRMLGTIFRVLAGCASLNAAEAFGQGDPEKLTQGANAYADYGIPIHKSSLLSGTDFAGASRVGVMTLVGKDKRIGLGLRRDAATTTFTQTNARMSTEWVDMTVGYRYWIFYPMLMVGSGNLTAKRDDVSVLDALCVERGGGLGLRTAVGKVLLSADVTYMLIQKTSDTVDARTKVKNRADLDISAMLPLAFDTIGLYAAYRFRSIRIEIAGAGKTELETGPSIGVNVGFSP